uniref:sn-1-specific diacylglycerol lipase ABHD11 n=1 Tax=Amblyomma triste TaxID=251400 RepID=A0A023G7H7_AMBTT
MSASACSVECSPSVPSKPCDGPAFLSDSVPLAYTLYRSIRAELSEAPPIIVLDGLFGNMDNWSELCEEMAHLTGRNVYAVDARNHGKSPRTGDMDYALMAGDVEQFMRDQKAPRATFIGHSMGGRTAMQLALYKPTLVERLVVVDVGPSTIPAVVGNYLLPLQLDTMDAVLPKLSPDMSFEDARREADRILAKQAALENPSIRELILANLHNPFGEYTWKVSVEAVRKNLPKLVHAEHLKGRSSDVAALFICGKLSPYVTIAEHGAIRRAFPKARIMPVEGAGHWVHKDKPEVFLKMVKDFMAEPLA